MFRSLTLAFLVAAPVAAVSQTDDSVNIVGTVTQSSASTLSVITDSRNTETFALPQNLLVVRAKNVSVPDIQRNDYVGSTASRGADGRLHAVEVRIFPEALRGVDEGQRRLDQSGSLTMTNATVTGTTVADGSNRLAVTYVGGQSELVVDRGAPVIRMEAMDTAAIRTGMKVRVQGRRSGGDGPAVARITILQ